MNIFNNEIAKPDPNNFQTSKKQISIYQGTSPKMPPDLTYLFIFTAFIFADWTFHYIPPNNVL